MKDIINPISGEIIPSPSLSDIIAINVAIKEWEDKIKNAKETVRQLARDLMEQNQYELNGYIVSRRTRTNVTYQPSVLRKLPQEVTSELLDKEIIQIKGGKLDDYIEERLREETISQDIARIFKGARKAYEIEYVEVRQKRDPLLVDGKELVNQ